MVTEKIYNSRIIIRSKNNGRLSFEKVDPAYSDESSLNFISSLSALIDAGFMSDETKILREFYTAIANEEEGE